MLFSVVQVSSHSLDFNNLSPESSVLLSTACPKHCHDGDAMSGSYCRRCKHHVIVVCVALIMHDVIQNAYVMIQVHSSEVVGVGFACLLLLSCTNFSVCPVCCTREVMIDGLKEGVFTAHSVWLCFIFGPIGLLSHLLTKWVTKKQRQRKSQ